jgi:hypothetical protein
MENRVLNQLDSLKKLQPPIIIVGTHRSGTSVLVSVLRNNSGFFGNAINGHEESLFFFKLNEYLLSFFKASWDKPYNVFTAINDQQLDLIKLFGLIDVNEFEIPVFLNSFQLFLCRMQYYKFWGWKDPRTSLLLPLWTKIFPNAKVLHICRNGMDVALSLYRREIKRDRKDSLFAEDLTSIDGAFQLWRVYENSILQRSNELTNYLRIKYEDLLELKPEVLTQLNNFCGIEINVQANMIRQENKGKCAKEFPQYSDKFRADDVMKTLGYS